MTLFKTPRSEYLYHGTITSTLSHIAKGGLS